MKRQGKLSIVTVTAVLAVAGGTALYAQEKYSLKTPDGIEFSDFKGYEDWSVVSSARTDEVLKVIVANPVMIEAYKAGVPGNGQPFPEGSKIAKLQWTFKKSTEAPFVVDVPDAATQAFLNAHSPSGTISPVSSATGIKLSGATVPRVGECQRIKASAPTIPPDSMFMMGWKSRSNSWRGNAVSRSTSSARRACTVASIAGSKNR